MSALQEELAAPLLSVRGLRVRVEEKVAPREILTGVDFDVARGETVAMVGESGSGKSLTARALIGLLPRGLGATGVVRFEGRDLLTLGDREMARVRGRRMSLILQDPFTMLNPVMRCGEQVVEAFAAHGETRLSRKAKRAEAARRLLEVGISDPTVQERYPFQLSGGMRQRVAIAAALAGNPELIIADEPSTALDMTTQAEILRLLKSIQQSRGMGLILITHDLRVAFSVADRIYVLYAGEMLETAAAHEIEREPLHPYSLGLLLAEPSVDRRQSALVAIQGNVPTPAEVFDRCAFEPRCTWAGAECVAGKPSLREVDPARQTACVRLPEIREAMREVRHVTSAPATAPAVRRTEGTPLISIRDLRKAFPGRMGQDVHALRGVTIEVGPNESVGLVGESGSGKTTLGRCVVGLETATSGLLEIEGRDVSDYQKLSGADRRELRSVAQMIFQDPYSSLDSTQTVGAALREVLHLNGTERHRLDGRVDELLTLVGLPSGYARRKPRSLSGGERQRVAIARALAVEPRLLVCDEPVSALDVSVQAQVLNLFRALRDEFGLSYLFITHDLGVVRQVVDRVYVLYRGEVIEEGPVDVVLSSPQHEYTARLIESIPRAASRDGSGLVGSAG